MCFDCLIVLHLFALMSHLIKIDFITLWCVFGVYHTSFGTYNWQRSAFLFLYPCILLYMLACPSVDPSCCFLFLFLLLLLLLRSRFRDVRQCISISKTPRACRNIVLCMDVNASTNCCNGKLLFYVIDDVFLDYIFLCVCVFFCLLFVLNVCYT